MFAFASLASVFVESAPPLCPFRDISPTRGEIVWSMPQRFNKYLALISADTMFV